MDEQRKLLKMQRNLKKLEKEELTLNGSISTLFKSLKESLGDDSLDDGEVSQVVKNRIKQLKKKQKKAKKQLADKMEQIEQIEYLLED